VSGAGGAGAAFTISTTRGQSAARSATGRRGSTRAMESRGDQTEVTLRHSGVPDDEMGRRHKEGWTWFLNALADAQTSRQSASSSD